MLHKRKGVNIIMRDMKDFASRRTHRTQTIHTQGDQECLFSEVTADIWNQLVFTLDRCQQPLKKRNKLSLPIELFTSTWM